MITQAGFAPAWWLPNGHCQTIWAASLRPAPRVALTRERLELPDGDFLDLDWTGPAGAPVVLVLHGLEGSADSNYVRGILRSVQRCGWRGVVMHFRGCSGEPNRLARSYHSGETGDLATVVATLRHREPDIPLAAVGYSLGGNVLLKWLGESGGDNPLHAAVAVSVPFLLDSAARRLEHGFSRVYQWHLINRMKRAVERKFQCIPSPVDFGDLDAIRTFYAFDDRITAPLHAFQSADDYYARSSSRRYLAGIRKPTLILHARDDVFMDPEAIPGPNELSSTVTLELAEHGGHVGFVGGRWPWRPEYWLETRIPAYLQDYLR